jgi:hydrogenase maturation protease
MRAEVVVLAVGNRSRGDDALGPLLLDRLGPWLRSEGIADRFELIEDYQLQIEHALDLQGRRLALFVDAGSGTPAPLTLERIGPSERGAAHLTHALSPEGLMSVYERAVGGPAPAAFVLCVRGERFELGEPVSVAAARHLQSAWTLLRSLCRRAEPQAWARACSRPHARAPRRS